MNRNLAASFALIATTLFVLTAPAIAQNRNADIRFEAAQRRFDGELAMFKAEVERYERARTAAPQASAVPPRAAEPQAMSDPLLRRADEAGADAQTAAPSDESDERENEPRQQ